MSQLPQTRPSFQSPAPAPAAPAAFKNACVACHDEDIVRQQRLTRAQWDAEINKMIGWGAKVSAEDRNTLLDYLFDNYGPKGR